VREQGIAGRHRGRSGDCCGRHGSSWKDTTARERVTPPRASADGKTDPFD
jgi:hypothetical protein